MGIFNDILQPTHLLFILVVALLVLGPKRLPEVGRSLGRGLRDFKNAISGDDRDELEEAPSATSSPADPYANAYAESPPITPAGAEPVSHATPESTAAAGEPADAEVVSHPSGGDAAPASEPAGLVR